MAFVTAFRDAFTAAVAGDTYTPFNNANAHIGVGNGTALFAASQTDLQGASKFRKPMDAGYPSRSANVLTFRSTFVEADANFAWEEWGVFNAGTLGTMMNRVVAPNGTKASTETKQVTATITFTV